MYKLITGPTIEPVSLSEIKNHLRLISTSPSSDRTPVVTIQPGSYPIGTITGEWIDVSGYNSYVEVQSIQNEATATLDLTIQESNNPDDETEINDYYSFPQITTENDGKFYSKDYDGGKNYIRVIGTVAGAAVNVGVNVIKDSPVCAEDDVLLDKFTVARQVAEQHLDRAFLTQTWKLRLKEWPRNKYGYLQNYIDICKPPVQSITSITYKVKDGTIKTLETTKYFLDDGEEPPKAVLVPGECWPTDELYPGNPITIEFVAGYTTPQEFKNNMHSMTIEWMCRAAGWMMQNREEPFDEEHFSRRGLNLDRWNWF
jgi:uncharacterized phiE125 gp8 family phage protein